LSRSCSIAQVLLGLGFAGLPPLRSSLGQPQPGQLFMKHPDIDAPPAPTTREALDQVWKEKGWVEAPPDPKEDALAKVRLISEGMPTLAPGKTIPILFDTTFSRCDGKGYPDAYRVKVTYESLSGRKYEDNPLLDLGIYWNIELVKRHDLHDVHAELHKIAETLKRWTGIWGLVVWSPDDERREHRRRKREQARLRAAQAS
jgi:hypothetical protein